VQMLDECPGRSILPGVDQKKTAHGQQLLQGGGIQAGRLELIEPLQRLLRVRPAQLLGSINVLERCRPRDRCLSLTDQTPEDQRTPEEALEQAHSSSKLKVRSGCHCASFVGRLPPLLNVTAVGCADEQCAAVHTPPNCLPRCTLCSGG